ncbi:MAG: hypothetical protein M0Z52_07475 [Actinomycetota bacterium]|nr:hypothetical protein [Actinomycetota bacterium]
MAQLKNSEGSVRHLQRIFFYGDEAREQSRVNSFLDYLSKHNNPHTGNTYELGARSLYRYISGEQHFPVDLLNALADWSGDAELMAAYNLRPAGDGLNHLKAKRENMDREIAELLARREMIDAQITGAEAMPKKKGKK